MEPTEESLKQPASLVKQALDKTLDYELRLNIIQNVVWPPGTLQDILAQIALDTTDDERLRAYVLKRQARL